MDCGEGVPKRCSKLTINGVSRELCICYNQWPTVIFSAYPRHPGPDPAPYVHVEGIATELMREIKLLDMVHYVASHLEGDAKKAILENVAHGLKAIQGKLPVGTTLL